MMEMLPYVVAKALGGPLIDRLGPKRVAIFCDSASVIATGLVPVLHLLGLLNVPVLLPVVFAMGVLRGPSDAAKQSMVPDIAELALVPLERVTGVVSTIERLASTAGAAGAGALIALVGPSLALAVNAATFAAAAVIVAAGMPALRHVQKAETSGIPEYSKELTEGWDFMRRDAVLVAIVLMVATTNLLDQAFFAVLVPVWTQNLGHGPALLGALFAVFSGASMIGAAIAALIGDKMPRLVVYTVAFLLAGFPRFFVFAVDSPLSAIFMILAIGGFASGFLNPIINAVLFERIPKHLTGRATSLNAALCWALIPFGGLAGGALIDHAGLSVAFFLAGAAYLATTLAPLAHRSFRGFERRRIGTS